MATCRQTAFVGWVRLCIPWLLGPLLAACSSSGPVDDGTAGSRVDSASELAMAGADLVALTPDVATLETTAPDIAGPDCHSDDGLLILGHRGFGWNHEANPYPENTILSAVAALEAGARGAEIDVTKTLDDVIVLAHEDALHFKSSSGLNKTTCSGYITKLSWSDIQDCLALPYMDGGFQEPLNRIEEIFAATSDALLILDVKNDQMDLEPWVTVFRIYDAALQAEALERVVLMLYQPETIRFARALGVMSCLKIHFRNDRTDAEIADEVAASGAWGLCAYSKLLTEELLLEHHVRGLGVSTYFLGATIADETFDTSLATWLDWGVHSVVTDRVGRGAYLMEQASCGHFP